MSSDITVTVAGFVGTTPRLFATQHGNDYTSFRVAHTRRQFDRERGEWVDGRTTWFTVKAWRAVARNVAASLRKGDPVVVSGRLTVDEWAGADGPRTDLVVEATALGPDLTRGEAQFRHTVHRREDAAGGSASRAEPPVESRAETVPDGAVEPAVEGTAEEEGWVTERDPADAAGAESASLAVA